MNDLPIVQKTYDLIKWYVPILNRLPRNHKYLLGDRIITGLYDFLEGLYQFLELRLQMCKRMVVVMRTALWRVCIA